MQIKMNVVSVMDLAQYMNVAVVYARNVEMSQVEVAVEAADPRAAFWLRDVEGADFFRLRVPSGAPAFQLRNVSGFRSFGSRDIADRQGEFRELVRF